MISRRLFVIVALLIVSALALTACGPGQAKTGKVYKIGFNSSATGTNATLGLPEAKTAEMIQKQINAAGGITGPDGVKHAVEIIIYDDENAADKAVSNVTRLIQEDEVVVVVSTTGSGTSVAHIPVCEENETACISMASAKAITTNKDGQQYKWMFKTPQTNGHAGEWQAAYLKAKGISNVCILYTDDGYGKDCLAEFKAAATKAGLQVVYEAGYASTDTEFSAQVAGAEASGCQAVEIGSTPPVASLATLAVRTAMPDILITLGHGVCNQPFINTAGAAAEGTVFPCGKVTVLDQVADSDPQKAVLAKYIKDYTEHTNGEAISTFGGHAWDGLMMAIDALKSLKDGQSLEEQRAGVRDYLENKVKNWPGISGTFSFSPSDHNGLTKESLLFVKVQNSKWVAFPESEWK
ncbi:MAG: ABC transporter substrate-binding protein [Thermoflexales bacterium]|nr:ABC transporter substrate-binding protein [Thermoflexales bacterium]